MEEDGQTRGPLKRPWDTCREVPVIEDERTPWKMIRLLRFISLSALAIIVFGLALCSKTSFLLLITLAHDSTKTLPAKQKPLALLCIGCCLIAPTILLLIKSTWKSCYKTSKFPRKATVALVLFFEFLVSVGVAILTIVAMPHLDVVTNVTIFNGVAVLSALLQVVAQCTAKEKKRFLVPAILAFILILLGYCLFLGLYIAKDPANIKMSIWMGLAVGGSILTSFSWWRNYFRVICENSSSIFLKNVFKDISRSQNMLHIFSSLLRIAVTTCVLGAYVPLAKMDWDVLTSIPGREARIIGIIIGVQLISSPLCHWFSLVACKMHAIRRCFVVPLYLASLAVMAVLIIPVIVYYQDYRLSLNTTENINFTSYCNVEVAGRNQSLNGSVFPHLVLDVTQTLCFLDMSKISDIGVLTGEAVSWWLGLVLATLYIFNLKIYRIQKTQDLFSRRQYDGAFIEQSLLLNTRFQIRTKDKKKCFKGPEKAMVYLCATMWHETYEEMMNIIVSIFRLDKFRPKDDTKHDDFNFETHIYFDDAFEPVEGSHEHHLNEYAKDLVKIMAEVYCIFKNLDKRFFRIHEHIPDQNVIRTPYGGRIVFTMPHGNNIIVHFKDKTLIRHKKRWSQVMYLYFLLGWKLMTKHYKSWQKGMDYKEVMAKIEKEKHNTYILALDGDTDFQPAAVLLLIDRLKMYPRVGAACGRIHPTGSGPAVWFQKFEYAVSHWLQKTAEHVFGCVLCSPGCFSLFRAEALMDDNVMKRYSTKSMEASQYIQYDQGEDRWLCTLMLKQGWRVEYNAASDAYTNAPENFKELYNQRKRWGPSTMANVVDLLGSTNSLSRKNMSISKPFMFYQLFAILSAILSPATICLMIAGSLSFVLKIPSAGALVLAVIPPAIYLGLCFKLKTDTQITIAAAMSIVYAFLMLVVATSIIASMVLDQTILTPSSIFIIIMTIIFITTAVMHPQEFLLIFYGLLYVICIPSAYLLLTIYSMVNMNSVSWGTRETKPAAGAAADAAITQQTSKQKAKSACQKFFSWLKCCKKSTSEDEQLRINQGSLIPEPSEPVPQPQNTIVDDISEESQGEMDMLYDIHDFHNQCWVTELQNMSTDIQLKEDFLSEEEVNFWNELQGKYLQPHANDKEKQKKTQTDLEELRNKINFSFFFVNALWLVAAFMFQIFDVFAINIDMVDFNFNKNGKTIQIEPMSLMFLLGFALTVTIQFIAMLYHRANTLIHYVAYLNTEKKRRPSKKANKDENSFSADSSYSSQFSEAANSHYQDSEEGFFFSNPNAGTLV
ncbi:chitin synthase chs-2-like isoform X2 [Cololabis saira]|uniref:chitin synthase chs-2-like isoform X2 n=1 Tax=Cololabis saira TaxID=129043 RepID=UPI002AD4F90D|nr:chitin synthase chs-2-like isoform X2 [Cololabis saira]